MERKQLSSYSSSSASNQPTAMKKYNLYGPPNILTDRREENDYNEGNCEIKSNPISNLPLSQHIIPEKMVHAYITKIIKPLRFRVLCQLGDNPTYSSTKVALIDELYSMIDNIRAGNFQGDPCYLIMMPNDILYHILSFINPRELRCMRGVSHQLIQTSYILSTHDAIIFRQGFVAYFAYNNAWHLGVVLCVIDTINPETYVAHAGVHVYIVDGVVTYFTNNDLAQYSYIGSQTSLPSTVPTPINHETYETPYGNDPHKVCPGHGDYTYSCGNIYAFTPPSTCLILHHNFIPNIQHEMVGRVVDTNNFRLHDFHLQKSLAREAIYGVSFEGRGSYNNNSNTLIDIVKNHIFNNNDIDNDNDYYNDNDSDSESYNYYHMYDPADE